MIIDIILIIGIETKCGMTGSTIMVIGVTMDGIRGVHLIGGHHSDTIGGDIIYTMVGITTDGVIMDTTVMDGITMDGITMGGIIITVKIIGTEDEVETMYHTSMDEEVVQYVYEIG